MLRPGEGQFACPIYAGDPKDHKPPQMDLTAPGRA
jgi:hypothetical protein